MTNRNREGLEGGQLAASFTPQERMTLVSQGYNPLNPVDVERYFNRQKPAEGLLEHAGVNKFKSLGGGLDVAPSDMGFVKGTAFESEFDTSRSLDPRQAAKSAMNNYASSSGFSGLDDRLNSLANRIQPINEAKKNPLITDPTQAKKVGYLFGTRYIKAYLENKQAPTKITKDTLLKETNNLKTAESKIHPSLLEQYNNGISIAEKEVFKKFKQ